MLLPPTSAHFSGNIRLHQVVPQAHPQGGAQRAFHNWVGITGAVDTLHPLA